MYFLFSCIISYMRRRSSGFGFWLFFIILLSSGFELFYGLFELAIVGIFGYTIYQIIKNIIQSGQRRNNVRTTTTNTKTTNMSNKERNLIDQRLREYFKDHYRLPVVDNIALTTQNGSFTTVENLYISYGEENILSLEEFQKYDPVLYNSVVNLLLAFAKQKEDVMGAEVKTNEVKTGKKLSDAQKYIDQINQLNTDIPNEEISNSLFQTCALLKQIDLSDKENKEAKLSKLYDYYLPILTGILENYRNLQKTGTDSKEFKDSETQLIKTIILINEALKTINESLHEEDYMNLSADITTLQSLLKKDGLVESNPFKEDAE